ncbi:hypothetical protein GGR61_001468 [Xanthomonas arboricola]|nr:hypothetical protein [Xanthomonas sp. 3075]MBB5863858.1 hypothetical protein [Xanthomonas sp. 3058]
MVAATATAQDRPAAAKKLYCWNQNGARVCSDTLPPEAVNQARDEFNAKSGMRSAEVQRAMSSDERAAAAASEQQRQADLAAEQMRQRTDQAMLMSYQSEDDLRRVFNERIAIIDNNIHTARFNVTSLREGLTSLLRAAGDRELAGQAIADKLAGDIQQRHRELLAQLRLQTGFEQQRLALDSEIADILVRYRAMKQPPDGSTPAS